MEPRDEHFYSELEKVLDAQFPKNKCKERGGALVLFAYANMLHNGTIREVTRIPKKRPYAAKA